MTEQDKQVLDWLKTITDDPENWHQWYSDSEVKLLAEQAIEMLTTSHFEVPGGII